MSKIDELRNKDEQTILSEYLLHGCSISTLLKTYKLSPNNKQARQYVSNILRQNNIDTSRSIQTRIEILGKDKLQQIINDASSVAEVLRSLGLSDIRINRINLITVCKQLNLEPPKYTRKAPSTVTKWTYETILKDFSNLSEVLPSNTSLKNWFIKSYTGKHTCDICGLGAIWNNKVLTLQLDHIDGNKKNNLMSNLRLLCPNCHSQTETYTRKNNIKYSSYVTHKIN